MKTQCYLLLPLILLTACARRMEAASLKVSPAGFIIHNVVPGKTYDVYKETSLQLNIYNDSEEARTYLLSAHRPSEDGIWEKGYLDIPDAQWCWFDNDEIKVEARSSAHARFHLRVPDEARYYNQRWVVTLNISGKPGPGGLGVAINVRAQVETQSRADIGGSSPYGLIGVVPSIITIKAEENGEVVIYNNGATTETYQIYALADKEKFKTYISAGLSPLPEPDWIKLSVRSLEIPHGDKKTLSLRSALREKESGSDKQYEAIIFVEGNDACGFVRVRIVAGEQP